LTPGQRQEATQVEALLECGAVARRGGGTRIRPARVAGDKGYTGKKIRRYLRRRKIGAVIPRLSNEPRRGVRFDRAAYRERNRVERAIRRLSATGRSRCATRSSWPTTTPSSPSPPSSSGSSFANRTQGALPASHVSITLSSPSPASLRDKGVE
jgi:hypothetical protein